MSVSDGDYITLIQKEWAAIGDGDTVQLGVVGLTQRNNVERPIVALNLELGVLSAALGSWIWMSHPSALPSNKHSLFLREKVDKMSPSAPQRSFFTKCP